MEKIVEVNGMKRSIYGEESIKIFEDTISKIKDVEKYLTNFSIDWKGRDITYSFGTDKNNIRENFELKFIIRGNLKLAELSTTWSNQYITDEFIELAKLLNDIRNEYNK